MVTLDAVHPYCSPTRISSCAPAFTPTSSPMPTRDRRYEATIRSSSIALNVRLPTPTIGSTNKARVQSGRYHAARANRTAWQARRTGSWCPVTRWAIACRFADGVTTFG